MNQVHFKQGMATARGIRHGSTYGELLAAYGEPPSAFEEHGYLRAEYELRAGDASCSLDIVLNLNDDQITDITLNMYQ